jgi:hypothetical protein
MLLSATSRAFLLPPPSGRYRGDEEEAVGDHLAADDQHHRQVEQAGGGLHGTHATGVVSHPAKHGGEAKAETMSTSKIGLETHYCHVERSSVNGTQFPRASCACQNLQPFAKAVPRAPVL